MNMQVGLKNSARKWLLLATLLGGFCVPVLAGTSPDRDRARALTVGCQGCHGNSGEGQGSLPPLRRLDQAHFIQRFQSFALDENAASVMHRIALGYTTDEIRLMAQLLATETTDR